MPSHPRDKSNPIPDFELATVLEVTTDCVYVLDENWRFVYLNGRAKQVLPGGEYLTGQVIWDAFPEAVNGIFWEQYRRAVSQGVPVAFEAHYTPLSSWYAVQAYPTGGRLAVFFRDITRRRAAEVALRSSEERLRLALDATKLGIWDWSYPAGERSWSREFRAILGVPENVEPSLNHFLSLVHPDDLERVKQAYASLTTSSKMRIRATYRILRADTGAERWVQVIGRVVRKADGQIQRVVGTALDITDRKLADRRVWHAAHHDPLTGLPNRLFFRKALEKALRRATKNRGSCVALLMLDLDGFKEANDRFGHDAGDILLCAAAARVKAKLRGQDVVSRLGGDEFAVLLPRVSGPEEVRRVAEAILAEIRQPVPINGRTIESCASAGGAIFSGTGSGPVSTGLELQKDADHALYAAKTSGRGTYVLHTEEMRARREQRSGVLARTREALASGQIVPFYQPQISLVSGEIVGFEALLRVIDPQRGAQSPGSISDAFKDPDLMRRLDQRIFERVLADMRVWLDAGLQFGRIAVNASEARFKNVDLHHVILEQLGRAGVPPDLFELEVAESVFLSRNTEGIATTLQSLSTNGVRIALDDFGTGYASLTHLRQFPVHRIKIDQSFVRGLGDTLSSSAIPGALVTLGHNLGIEVVAEGIETAAEASALRAMGCQVAQGFLYARAMAGSRVPFFISRHNPSQARAMAGAGTGSRTRAG